MTVIPSEGIFNFFETMGYLVKTKNLKINDIKGLMGKGIVSYYELSDNYIMQKRKGINEYDFLKNFEYLKDECKEKNKVIKFKRLWITLVEKPTEV